jgi:aryl-alcohol dehydrogenase-like predicted oxidoreductase
MAQIAFAWSAKKVTAPIIGTTKLDNLKEMISKKPNSFRERKVLTEPL